MYTSGSTGLPKGVAVTHANVANYTARMLDRFGTNGGLAFEVLLRPQHATRLPSVFPPLAGGGSVHLISPEVVIDPEAFAAHMSETQVDVLKITPSLLAALLGTESRAVLPRRWLVCGGEAFSLELLERIRALGGSCRILNHYGPTETTIGHVRRRGVPDAAWPSATVPIGRPLEREQTQLSEGTQATHTTCHISFRFIISIHFFFIQLFPYFHSFYFISSKKKKKKKKKKKYSVVIYFLFHFHIHIHFILSLPH